MSFSEKHAHVLYLPSISADVGADILDLAETMITSSSLQYEPVSEASNPLRLCHFLQIFFFSHNCFSSLCTFLQTIFELTPQQRLWQR